MQIKMLNFPIRNFASVIGILIAIFGFYTGGFIVGLSYAVSCACSVYAIYQMFPVYFSDNRDFKNCWRSWGSNIFDVLMLIAGIVGIFIFIIISAKSGTIPSIWYYLLGPACFFAISSIIGFIRYYLD